MSEVFVAVIIVQMAQRLEVEKFTGKQNFSLWQRKVRALLSQNDTVDALAGVGKKPELMTLAAYGSKGGEHD